MNLTANAASSRAYSILDTLLFLGSLTLVAWSGVYLGHYGGRFHGNEFDAVPSKRTGSAGPVGPPESPEFKRGRIVYALNCQACHGARGEGEGTPGVPPLDKSEWVTGAGASRLMRILIHAVDGPMKVLGKDYNNPGMLAWGPSGSNLPAEDLAAVATFIRQAWSNKASTVTVDQIKAVLDETKGRETKWTEPELLKIPETVGGAATNAPLTNEQLLDKLKALPPEKLQDILKALGK